MKKYETFIKNNSAQMIKSGWDIGYHRISHITQNIRTIVIPSDKVSNIEILYELQSVDTSNYGLINLATDIHKVVERTLVYIPDARFTIDVSYSVSKHLTLTRQEMNQILVSSLYEQKRIDKSLYRKFEVIFKRNVTSTISLHEVSSEYDLNFRVDVENIVITLDNIKEELENSMYFFYLQYIKFHNQTLRLINPGYIEKKKKLYDKIQSKYK